jgi:hypothetical protein
VRSAGKIVNTDLVAEMLDRPVERFRDRVRAARVQDGALDVLGLASAAVRRDDETAGDVVRRLRSEA